MAFLFETKNVSPELVPMLIQSAHNFKATGVLKAEIERVERSLVGETRNLSPAELLSRIQRHHVELEVLESLQRVFEKLAIGE